MKATAKAMIGRTITAVDFRPFPGAAQSPVLTLDNGRQVYFVTEKTDATGWGISTCITPRKRKGAR